ncbi:MAG TPA: endolytic transglycosylase MltG [Myxococcota bacterium]|nr:endolytic transglycosylase MltG [Myxococcota bacterium]
MSARHARRKRVLALSLVAVLLVGIAAAFAAKRWWDHALGPPDRSGAALVVEVPRGATFGAIAAQLEAAGAIRSARAFTWLARLEKKDGSLHAGEYEIAAGMPAREVLALLVEGRVRLHAVAIPEGLRIEEIAQRVAEAGFGSTEEFVALARDPAFTKKHGVPGATLEGYLFPETYRFERGAGAREVITAQLAQFERAWSELAPLARARGLGKREVVILASLIEKETGAAEERPLISAVFHNRIAKGIRLETDPAVIYGIANFDGNLTRAHLEDGGNPYNTYRIAGLPPGPIANPGAASLRAAVSPAPGVDYLYFVSRGDGTHVFTTSYRDHVNAVNRFQRRGGRR